MKVNFYDKGKDKIVMTLSHGLQISMDRVEVLMIRDACNEFLENETGSIDVSGEFFPRGAKKMVAPEQVSDEERSCETCKYSIHNTGELCSLPCHNEEYWQPKDPDGYFGYASDHVPDVGKKVEERNCSDCKHFLNNGRCKQLLCTKKEYWKPKIDTPTDESTSCEFDSSKIIKGGLPLEDKNLVVSMPKEKSKKLKYVYKCNKCFSVKCKFVIPSGVFKLHHCPIGGEANFVKVVK